MDSEKLAMQKRIDNLQEHTDYLHGVITDCEQQNANLMEELKAVKRERDALLKTIDVEYIARLEEKAIKLDMLEETLKRGFYKVNGGAEG